MRYENHISEFIEVTAGERRSATFAALQEKIGEDIALAEAWYDFLLEQYLADTLKPEWMRYTETVPDFSARLMFHHDVNRHIDALHARALRNEIHTLLPKTQIAIPDVVRRRRDLIRWIAVAAVAMGFVLTVVFRQRSLPGPDIAHEIPVLMVEPFETFGVTEEMIVHGIPQRLPVKLTATEGIYPVTHFAVAHAPDNASGDERMHHLGADYALRGSVKRVGGTLEVEARLVNIGRKQPVWSEKFVVADDVRAIDDMQDAMSLRIAESLQIPVSPQARDRMGREISADVRATELFLQGERLLAERTKKSLEQSIVILELANDQDSSSALIRGYLAYAYDTYAENDWGDSSHWAHAVTLANATLQQDPLNPEALVVLGDYAETVEKAYPKAEEYFRRALSVQPGDAKIHQAIAELHLRTGKIEEGLPHIHIARIVEPEHRVVRWVETKYLTASGRLEDALIAAQDLMRFHPEYPNIQNFLWQYYLSRREYDQALEAIPVYDSTGRWRTDYMLALTYIDRKDTATYSETYTRIHPSLHPSLDLLWNAQNDRWDAVYVQLDDMLTNDAFHLLAMFQTSDFDMFNKMKENRGVQDIFTRHGIVVHRIPDTDDPEM